MGRIAASMLSLGILTLSGCSTLSSKYPYQHEKIEFVAAAGETPLKAQVYRPTRPGRTPAVLVIHGGGWNSRTGDMTGICQDLAREGFLAFNTTYRLAPGALFPKALNDVTGALRYMRENAEKLNIDPDRIYVWGYSAGAHLGMLLGLDESQKIRGIVSGGTPADLVPYPKSPLIIQFLGKELKDDRALWEKASPINHVGDHAPPVFLYHGAWDKIVGIEQMWAMQKKLKSKHQKVETLSLDWQGHIAVYLFSQRAIDEGILFLRKLEREQTAGR